MNTPYEIDETSGLKSEEQQTVIALDESTGKSIQINLPLFQFSILSRKAAAAGMSVEDMVAQIIYSLMMEKE